MAKQFGLTSKGYVPMQQQEVVSDLESAFQDAFGKNINLASRSVFGQLIGILSERFTLLWQLGEAIYTSQYPGGAEGTSVDNILALNNMVRLKASPTVTQSENDVQDNGVVLYGLVLKGTPGTFIQAGSIIQTSGSPAFSFTLDAGVTIGSAVNAEQTVFFGNTPDAGSFSIDAEDPSGNLLTTNLMTFQVLASNSEVLWGVIPTTGHYHITLTRADEAPVVSGVLQYNDPAATIQAALRLLSGYGAVTVVGNPVLGGFTITWGAIAVPFVTITTSTLDHAGTVVDSLQAELNNLFDADTNKYPYTDVAVTGDFATGMVCQFGANTPVTGNPASGSQQIPLMTVDANTLQMGSTVTNINITTTQKGTPALALGQATCTENGAKFVASGALTVIGSPVSGWNSVNNELDCVTGRETESDTEAMQRRSQQLSANANGPLQSIVEKVQQVSGVTQAKGFDNLNSAALQVLSFDPQPSTGGYKLNIDNQTTGTIAYNASSSTIQTAVRLLTGYSNVLVTGDTIDGFTFDFNGSQGGQAQQLYTVSNDTTDGNPSVAFGRPGNSFEIVVQGGSDNAIAQAIYAAQPAGIKSYGNTTIQITDAFGTPVNISFSRPSPVTIYVVVSMVTDTYNTPGNPGSGANANAKFVPGSVADIQQDILVIGNAVAIGGIVIGFGSDGLIGAFNGVPGIISYTLYFGKTSNPVTNTNVSMLAEQVPLFESFNTTVSWT